MELKNIKDAKQLKGKRVLVRMDIDVPLGGNLKIDPGEDLRIQAGMKTIKYLLDKKAQVIVCGHMGRPKGQPDPELRTRPVAEYLARQLGAKTGVSDERLGVFPSYMFRLEQSEFHVLENLRFNPGEELNNDVLAKDLADIADVYVNEAFAVSHREHASVSAVQKLLPNYAGFSLVKEVSVLGKVLKRPSRPLTLIVGGVKAETKLKLVEKFIPRADFILLGSAVANNFYKRLGYEIGGSLYDKSLDPYVDRIVARPKYSILEEEQNGILLEPAGMPEISAKTIARLRKRVILPVDIVAAPYDLVEKGSGKINIENIEVSPEKRRIVPADLSILDIGPKTASLYGEIIKRSKTIIWNGPMGYFEKRPFDLGTFKVAEAVAGSRGKGIVGGGDTIGAVESEHIEFKQNVFTSMGGGAMLEFLLDPKLPGIKPLIKKSS